MKKTIAVDFDGVIHAYSKKWHDGTIYDLPIPGAKLGMATLQSMGYEVIIYSTRAFDRVVNGVLQPNQRTEMRAWLDRHGIPYDGIAENGKPLCVLFIDDNAYRFGGKWSTCVFDVGEILHPGEAPGAK